MTSKIEKVVVMGAGGDTGQRVTRLLAGAGYQVTAVTSSTEKVEQLRDLGVQDVVVVELGQTDVATLASLLQDKQAVVSALGATSLDAATIHTVEIEGTKKVVEAAQQAGIERFVLTSSIATEHPDRIPYLTEALKAKRIGEQTLIDSGLDYTIVRPGGLTDEDGGQPLKLGRGDTLSGRISRQDVAAVLLEALQNSAASRQIVEIVADPDGKLPNDPTFFD